MLHVLRTGAEEPRRTEPTKLFYLYALQELGGCADLEQMRSFIKDRFNLREDGAKSYLNVQSLKREGFVRTCIQSRRVRSRRNRLYQITESGKSQGDRAARFIRAGEQMLDHARKHRRSSR